MAVVIASPLQKVNYDFFTMYAPTGRLLGGQDVVFFHGFLGDHREYAQLLAAWDAKILTTCNIYLCDLPGHGASRFGTRQVTLPQVLETMRQALATLGVERPIYVGYSMGGRLALALADEMTKALFLESSSWGMADPLMRRERLARDKVLLQAVLACSSPLERRAAFETFLRGWYSAPLFDGITEHPDFAAMLEKRLQGDPFELQKGLAILSVGNFPFLWEQLVQFNRPVVWLYGERDTAYQALGRQLCEASAPVIVHEIKRCSHNIHRQQRATFLELLAAFLEENAARA